MPMARGPRLTSTFNRGVRVSCGPVGRQVRPENQRVLLGIRVVPVADGDLLKPEPLVERARRDVAEPDLEGEDARADLPGQLHQRQHQAGAAFFVGLAHFLWYAMLDIQFDGAELAKDLTKRTYIIVGFIALLLLRRRVS